MTGHAMTPPDTGMDMRWRHWQGRSAKAERRRAAIARRLSMLVGVGVTIWLLVQLA